MISTIIFYEIPVIKTPLANMFRSENWALLTIKILTITSIYLTYFIRPVLGMLEQTGHYTSI